MEHPPPGLAERQGSPPSLAPRSPRETPRARQAWADYLALGPGRTLEGLLDRYRTGTGSVPVRRLSTLKDWSRTFGWQRRLQRILEAEERAATERQAAYVRAILEEGFGLAHERVRVLKLLAERLLAELLAEGEASRLWVRDVKGIGRHEEFREVEVVRFNAAELRQLRGLLDDIAKETGERRERVQVSGQVDLALRWSEAVARALPADPDVADGPQRPQDAPWRANGRRSPPAN